MEVMRVLLFFFTPGLLAQAPPVVPPDPFDFWPLVTPLLGDISRPCFDASMEYVNGILNGSTWAIQMFDSSGHLPFLREGLLSDMQPLPICGILEAMGILGDNPCPAALQNYPLMIPFGYAVGLGDQDVCTSVAEVPTHFCHNALTMGSPVQEADEFEAQSHPWLPLHALDGENIMRMQQQPIKELLKNPIPFPRKQNSSLTATALHGRPPFPFATILQRNPAIQKIIRETTDDLSKIIQTVCPDCKVTNGEGQVLMMWSILWWFVNMNNGGGVPFPPALPAYRGCYPEACTKWDVMINSHQLGELYGVAGMSLVGVVGIPEEAMSQLGINYDPLPGCSSDERYNNENWVNGNYVAVTIFSALGLLLLAGTLYDVFLRSRADTNLPLPEKKQENIDQGNKYLLSFSILQNLEFILSTKATGRDRLDCVEGIRAISMTWVVLGHTFLYSTSFLFVNNKIDATLGLQIGGLGARAIFAGPYAVDSFFFIGATLVSYLLLKDLDKTNGWGNMKGFIHMVLLYVNRILRISIPYAIYILYIAGIQHLLFKEPMDVGVTTERLARECQQHWTANLLYLNNFVSEGSACIPHAWYLGTDMWFFVFAPLIVYPLWLSKFNSLYKVAAYAWWFMFLALSVAWSLRCTFEFTGMTSGEIPCWMDVVGNPDFAVYGRRNQCYIVGLLLGHLLHITKGKKINIPPAVNLLIWEAVLLLFFALVYAPYDTDLENYSSGKPVSRFWYACSLLMWGLCLSWLIFACCRGLGGIVNNFLTWRGWVPIAKISFMTYLVHQDWIWIFFSMQVKRLKLPFIILLLEFSFPFVCPHFLHASYIVTHTMRSSSFVYDANIIPNVRCSQRG